MRKPGQVAKPPAGLDGWLKVFRRLGSQTGSFKVPGCAGSNGLLPRWAGATAEAALPATCPIARTLSR